MTWLAINRDYTQNAIFPVNECYRLLTTVNTHLIPDGV